MRGTQLDHFAGANEQQFLVSESGEYAQCQLHRRRCHGYYIRADRRVRAHLLCHRKGTLEQAVQCRAQRARGFGRAHRILHLSEDLRFAQHHGVQARSNAKGMTHRLRGVQRVGVALQFLRTQVVVAGQPFQRLARFARSAIQFGTVAGRENGRFTHRPRAFELCQHALQLLSGERHPLADRDGCTIVVQAESEQLHGPLALCRSGGSVPSERGNAK